MKKFLLFFAILTVFVLLMSCGNDSGSDSVSDDSTKGKANVSVAMEDDLPNCTAKREGQAFYVKKDDGYYQCQNFHWVNLVSLVDTVKTLDDLDTCTGKHEGESKIVEEEESLYTCQDGEWMNIGGKMTTEDDHPDCSKRDVQVFYVEKLDSNCTSRRECQVYYVKKLERSLICEGKKWLEYDLESCSSYALSSSSEKKDGSFAKGSSSRINDDSEYDSFRNTLTDLRDGKVYKTVTIGSQVWMTENLNYAYNVPTTSEDSSSFCYGDGSSVSDGSYLTESRVAAYCAKYGRIYLWSAAMDSAAVFSDEGKGCGYYGASCSVSGPVRGVCPSGWHLPSWLEWDTLFTNVGGTSIAIMLKSVDGINDYGFPVLPAGYRHYYGFFDDAGNNAYFWSSNVGNNEAYGMYFYDDNSYVSESYFPNSFGFSVRCVMNKF